MEIQDKDSPDIVAMKEKILKFFPKPEHFMGLFATILGAADQVSRYILEKERDNYLDLPVHCKYGLLHVFQVLNVISKILRDEIPEGEGFRLGGYFPTDAGAWQSDEDFEERLILFVKLFYEDLKKNVKL
jgi:hypothetical protein